jgi:hypothetical protein
MKLLLFLWLALPLVAQENDLKPLKYNHPGLVVDLGVGLWAWPLPMDWDGDGDLDLVVSCPDKPYNGTYFFENPGGSKMPVFEKAVRIGKGYGNIRVSYSHGKPEVLLPGKRLVGFVGQGFGELQELYRERITPGPGKVRARQWQYADYDGDGMQDLIVGEGFWGEYGWDDAFDENGNWTNGPLHGWVYFLRNSGSNENPDYEEPRKIEADGRPVDVYGMPSPNLVDFDGDGDLDLLCGEFLDGFTYFQNTGSATRPKYAAGRRLQHEGKDLAMHVQMITPTAIDWDGDGDQDLIVGDEDGRVALVEHTGEIDEDGLPRFLPPVYFQQEADDLKFGALATPYGFDWDGDGDEDIIAGNTAGNMAFFENLDGEPEPKWAAPVLLEAGGQTIHIQAGPNGSIQGPCEAKWGYTTLSVGDWNHDELPDLVVNSIWGKVIWFPNVGTRTKPQLGAAQPVEVAWKGDPPKPAWNWWSPGEKELVTQWRTTPVIVDWNKDGLNDLVMLDHEGYLALFERKKDNEGRLSLLPGQRVFVGENGSPIAFNTRSAGKSGRRKIDVVDWDRDGDLDILLNSINAELYRNEGSIAGKIVLKNMGHLARRKVSGHTSSPTTIDLNGDGKWELLVGAEDGRFYHLK